MATLISYSTKGLLWLENTLNRKLDPDLLVFSDLSNTNPNTISFWNGKQVINSLISGLVLVDSQEDKRNLLKFQSNLPGFNIDNINIIQCNSSMPNFFWRILKELIIPFNDSGNQHIAGDQFTLSTLGKFWVSEFATIGNGFRSGIGSLIGCIGVATYQDEDSGYLMDIPHLGQVIIGDSVRLSNYVIISRAILGNTSIGDSTVIGTNTVIGHNVSIGKSCFIGPNVTICGSARIHSNVFIGAGSIITNQCEIPSHSYICAGAVITKSYSSRVKLVGNPARAIPL